ncbi:hypothetical protein FSP39_012005 [Pinctada imbricata]|uniref:protein-tyrosine-phosphatase n=1 Tax=Pinctada imbricata TaxID=66713 RepID=A0AA88YAH5_PINIB|nr:hypothetical protein FSP39_012005 [Pinctada imbricata]
MTETVTTQYQKNQSKRLYVVTDKTSPHLLTQTVITNTLDKIPTTSSPFPSIVKEISSRNLDGLNGKIVTSSIIPSKEPIQFSSKLVTRERRSITETVSNVYPSVSRKDQEIAHDETLTKLISSNIIENTTNRNPSSSSTVSSIKQDISTTIPKEPESPVCKDDIQIIQRKAKSVKLSLQNINLIELNTFIFIEVRRVDIVEERNQTANISDKSVKIMDLEPGKEYEVKIFAALTRGGRFVKSQLPCRNATRFFTRPKIKKEGCKKIKMQCNENTFEAVVDRKGMLGVTDITFSFQAEEEGQNDDRYIEFGEKKQIKFTTNITRGFTYNISAFGIGPGNLTSENVCFMKSKCVTMPSAVMHLNSSATPTTIAVQWMTPMQSNGIITRYVIKLIHSNKCLQQTVLLCKKCRNDCGNSSEIQEHSLANNYTEDNFTECQKTTRSRSFNHSDVKFREIISDLTPQTSYDIVVFAATLAGGGKETKIKEWTKGDVPGNVRNLQIKPNGTGFAISFSPPEQRNGKILEYEISYEPQYVNKSCLRNIEKYNIQNVSLRPLNPEQKDTGYKHALIDLYPFWNYTVGVRARTSEGYGNRTLAYEITNTAEPGHIENLTVVNVTHDQIFLKWKEPCFTNGIIKHYLLMISSNSDDGRNFTSKTTFITISELFPYTSYNITVFTVSEEDLIDLGVTEANITTKCSGKVPQSPADLRIANKTSTTFMLSWKEPEFETCFTKYYVTATDVNDKAIRKSCLTEGFHNVSCTIKGLDEYWEYDIKLVAVTINGTTPWNGTLKERTSPSAPGNVTSLRIVPERDILAPRTIKIQFNPPPERERNGIITSYVIVYWNQSNKKKAINISVLSTEKYVIDDISLDSNEVVLSSVRPDNYTVQIYATSTHDDSGLNKITRSNIVLEDGAPPLFASITGNRLSIQPARQTNVENDQTQFPIVISNSILCNTESGEVIERGIIISEVSQITGTGERSFRGKKVSFENRKVQEYSTWSRVYELDNMQPYIATDDLNVRCGTAPNLVPTIVGVTTGVLLPFLVVITVVVLVLVYRRKSIIQKLNISDHVNRLHKDSNDGFSEEYKHLKEQTPTHTTEAAAGQATRIKNRYTNILAYDHSRVKLLPLDDEDGTDYINANYIPGYTSEREYIATQGPLECTKDDFWRMIWEQEVSVIVMLTQLVERGRRKCDMYWPSALNEPVYFGDLIVEMTSESTLDDYTLRVISVELGNKKKRIKQFHYLKWPDMGCPETTWLLLNFAQTMRIYLPHNCPGPIVVHCSAGVGRTGTFIAVDHLMQHVRDHDTLDIFNLVLGMRNNRSNMVQTEDQYVFIHDCMKDYIEELQKEDDVDEDVDDGDVDDYDNTDSRFAFVPRVIRQPCCSV